MNHAKVGFYVGAIAGLVLFVAVWLLPVSLIGGVTGSKIQEYISGNSQGVFAAIIMIAIVIFSGALMTVFASCAGWVGGTVIGALLSTKSQTQTEETKELGFNSSTVRVEEA